MLGGEEEEGWQRGGDVGKRGHMYKLLLGLIVVGC